MGISRFTYSGDFIKTNIAFGNDNPEQISNYKKDYTQSSCSATSNGGVPPLCTVMPGPTLAERKKAHQCTNLKFGNDDNTDAKTAYQEFAARLRYNERQRACLPPDTVQIFPQIMKNSYKRSSQRNDYIYFGPQISKDIYKERNSGIRSIKAVNTYDAVGKSLSGHGHHMITHSMVDYRHPSDQVRNDVKFMMVKTISPAVRSDAVWQSVNCGGSQQQLSEQQRSYVWPRQSAPPFIMRARRPAPVLNPHP